MKKYFLNPELHRNFWIEFTPLRLVAMPVLLGLGFFVFTRMQGEPFLTLCTAGMTFFFIIVTVWGCHTAASTLQDEVRNNVWDFQRTSSISPASYAFGKLFGSTSYVWYFGIAIWMIFAVAFLNMPKPELLPGLHMPGGIKVSDIPVDTTERLHDFIYVSAFMFLAGFFGQVTSFMTGCKNLTAATGAKKIARWRANLGGFIAGVAASSFVYGLLVSPFFNSIIYEDKSSFGKYLESTHKAWYGFELSALEIAVVTVLFFLGWQLTGIYRLMKQALLCKTLPIAWPLFTLTFLVYLGGFANNLTDGLKMTMAFSLVMAYFIMFGDAADPSKYRRLAAACKLNDKLRMFENTPSWVLAAIFPLILLPALLLSSRETEAAMLTQQLGIGYLSAIFFMVRDGLVIHSIFRGVRLRHARFAVIAYYAIAYMLLPLLFLKNAKNLDFQFLVKGTEMPETLRKDYISAFFIPSALDDWWISVIVPLAEAMMAGVLMWWVVRKK